MSPSTRRIRALVLTLLVLLGSSCLAGQFAPGNLLLFSKVVAARRVGEVLQGTFSKGDPVIETKHAYRLDPYRLFVDPSCGGEQRELGPREQDQPLFEHLRSSLGALDGFECADSSEVANFFVCVLRPKKLGDDYERAGPGAGLPDYFIEEEPEVWVVEKGALAPVHEFLKLSLRRPEDGVEMLGHNLKAYLRGQEVIRFGLNERPGKKPDIRLFADLLREVPASKCTADSDWRKLPYEGSEGRCYRSVDQVKFDKLKTLRTRKGDILEFRAHNASNDGLYLYLINISKNLAVNVIYPDPDSEPLEYPVFKPGDDRYLDYGTWLLDEGDDDWFKFFVTTSPIDVNVFVRKGLVEYRASR